MAYARSPFVGRLQERTSCMGGDRELVMFSILLAAVLIFTSQDWIAAGVGIGIWGGALFLLRKMAKSRSDVAPCLSA